MNTKVFTLYKGEVFTVEWYFDRKGRSQALEYFLNCSPQSQNDLLKLVKRIGDFGKISDITKFRNEGDKIFAFKPQPDRYLCFFFVGRKMVITNAFRKKCQKLPVNEKGRASQCKCDFEERIAEGSYYEKN